MYSSEIQKIIYVRVLLKIARF